MAIKSVYDLLTIIFLEYDLTALLVGFNNAVADSDRVSAAHFVNDIIVVINGNSDLAEPADLGKILQYLRAIIDYLEAKGERQQAARQLVESWQNCQPRIIIGKTTGVSR